MSRDVVIVDGVRTPYAKANTELKDVPVQDLGRIVTVEVLARTGFDGADLDEVVFGNIAQPLDAVNVARVASLYAGVPARVPAFTVNRLCGSLSDREAAYRIAAGMRGDRGRGHRIDVEHPLLYSKASQEVFTESFTARERARIAAASKFRPKHFKPEIGLQMGLTDAVCGLNMGETAELLAREHGISRQEQDDFALRSHQRVVLAREKLAQEIVPVPVPPTYETMCVRDNGVRENQTIEALAKLRPFFDRKFGTVTAGNSSQITDGGAATLVMSASAAKARGYKPLGKIRGFAFCALEPERMGLGPAVATPLALKKAGVEWNDIGLVEINEAFARPGPRLRPRLSFRRVAREIRDGRPDRGNRLGPHERQRRGDRPGAPRRLLRQPPRHDALEGDAPPRHRARARHDVHRRRPGRRHSPGADVRKFSVFYSSQFSGPKTEN
jgi:acetyl-CoA acetyltransferase family protein